MRFSFTGQTARRFLFSICFVMAALAAPPAFASVCGDSEPDPGEQCDDGNLANGDGCSAVCLVEAGFVCTPAIASIPGNPPTPPVPSSCAQDSDGDGVGDDVDNCPADPNADQSDRDGDGVGDVCDNCPDVFNPGQEDSNGDGIGDACSGGPPGGPAACDVDGDGDIDGNDIRAISNARGTLVPAGIPGSGDFDANGEVNRRDVTACAKLL